MKKIIIKNLILIFFALIITSQGAFCTVLSNENLRKIIINKIQTEQGAIVEKYSSDYKFNITGIINDSVVTGDNLALSVEIADNTAQSANFNPNSYKRVVIKNSNGTIVKSFPINVQTLIYKEVLVASCPIQYKDEVNFENAKYEKREISKYLDKVITNYQGNLTSKRNYQKGAIILSNSLEEKSAILKDSTIDIVFQSPKGLNIKIQGKALKDGSIGQIIPVRSNQYNKIYNATIVSTNEVSVRI